MKINFLFFIIFITLFLFVGLFRISAYASEDLVLDIFRQVDSDITLLNNFVENTKNVDKDSILSFREETLNLIYKLENSINYYQKKRK